MAGWLDRLQEDTAAVVERARRSLVSVRSGRRGAGAAVVWDERGTLVTNAHVVGRGRVHVLLPDGQEAEAETEALDQTLDLAALRVDVQHLHPIARGDARRLRPGEWVYALGHPWGVQGAATGGVVIGMGSDLPEVGDRERDWLLVGLHLRPGHSGGPMIDASGCLVGLNTMMTGPDVGAAVPIHVVEAFVRDETTV
ncbi:MAG TPA: trypsin-like peptidase domain-containing protein [Anaerolineales bacterium]|nr:trypsin-like peptidase domain-containing protein [Anaerolineales bacterium]